MIYWYSLLHLDHLRLVLEKLNNVGLKFNPGKCCFIHKDVEYLGHVITPHGLLLSDKLVAAAKEYELPRSVQELSSYHRQFVPHFARIAHPLHQLTCKGMEFVWSPECETAFKQLKDCLVNNPVLAYPSFDKEFILETDASAAGLGAVLSQCQVDGLPHPTAYATHALSPSECNYGITDLETLAVVWALSHFHYYLYGHKVKVITNHTTMKAVLDSPNPSGRHARWWMRVFGQGIELLIFHRVGKENLAADTLSCSPHGKLPNKGIGQDEIQVAIVTTSTENIPLLRHEPHYDPVYSELTVEQRKDPSIMALIDYLQRGKLPKDPKQSEIVVAKAPSYCVMNDILYFINGKRRKCQLVVIPKQLQKNIGREPWWATGRSLFR